MLSILLYVMYCVFGKRSMLSYRNSFFGVQKCRAHENIIDKTIYKIVCSRYFPDALL